MAWTTVKNWAGSEVLTSADLDTYLSDNTDYLYDNCPATTGFLGGINGTTWTDQLNQRIESGTTYIPMTTAAYGSATVTFNTAYGTGPRVVTDPGNIYVRSMAVSVGTGGFTMYAMAGTGGTVTGSIYPTWQAIGA